jgi:hypothetical protein
MRNRASRSWVPEKASHVERSAAIDPEVQSGDYGCCLRLKVVIQPTGQTETLLITCAPCHGVTKHDDSPDSIMQWRPGGDLLRVPRSRTRALVRSRRSRAVNSRLIQVSTAWSGAGFLRHTMDLRFTCTSRDAPSVASRRSNAEFRGVCNRQLVDRPRHG